MTASDTAAGAPEVAPDVDLRRLPRPPKTWRTVSVAVMAVTWLAAVSLGWSLWPAARFALRDDKPLEIGALAEALLGPAHDGAFVSAAVDVGRAEASVGYRRVGDADSYRVALVSRQGAGRWVAFRVPKDHAGPRFVPPRLVAGRLAKVDELGARYRGVKGALVKHAGGGGWVLLDEEDPRSVGWVLALEVLLAVYAGWSLWSIFRLLRRTAPTG